MDELLNRAVSPQLVSASAARSRTLPPIHTANYLAFYLGILAITLCSFQPVFALVSLSGALLCSISQLGPRAALAQTAPRLPLVLLVAALNPLFSASGSTLLLKLGPMSIYMESIAWGLCAGTVLLASLTWFSCLMNALSYDQVLGLFGGVLPTCGLVTSMAMRLVPSLVRRGHHISEVRRACTSAPGHDSFVRTANVMVGWALEDSLVAADSMRARGWGSTPARTRYHHESYRLSDLFLSLLLLVLFLIVAFLAWVACRQYHFYPTMSRLVLWWGYLPWTAYVLLAAAVFRGEESHARRA